MEFQLIAIAVLVAFYGCYIVKMICQKKKGIQTDQIGKGKVGFVKFIEITMKIAAFLVLIVGVVSVFLGISYSSIPVRIIGAAMSIAGTVVFITAVLTMRDSWRAGVSKTDKTELVTSGIYQISRNPAFLGFDLLYLGILLMFFNWVLCAVSVFAILMYHLQIVNVEEEFLLAAFGNEYLQYKKKVCRYIGRKR
ncbi:MAG: isoprenylcysteine carboxylmethyltransferase family protein [Lachnospiraceae bacterium]|nr:isoprenylcysteine carboxylmethyltransferase family protein [Lachnospiraceae bacterium]